MNRLAFLNNSRLSTFPFIRRLGVGLTPFGVIMLFVGLVSLFFWKIIFFPEKFRIPYDIHGYHYPLASEIFAGLKQGYLPLWDPYVYSGMPLVSYTPNEIVLSVESPSDAFLLLTELFHPGWRVYVNGLRVEMIKANGIFRAVRISRGRHRVLFRYEPRSLRTGAMISAVTLLSVIVPWLINVLTHRRRVRAEHSAKKPS